MALPGRRRPAPDGSQPRRRQPSPITTAAEDLYRACHLPPPAVLIARDGVHFGRLVGRLARGAGLVEAMCVMLFVAMLAVMLVPPAGDPIAAAYAAFMAAVIVPWIVAGRRAHRGLTVALGETSLRMLAGLLLGVAVFGVARLMGAEHRTAMVAAGFAMGASGCVQLVSVLLAPCIARWRLGRTLSGGSRSLPWSVTIWGARRVDAVLSMRLDSALQGVEQARGRDLRGPRSHAQHAMQFTIRAAVQDQGIWPGEIGLVLGQSIGYSTDAAARVGALATAGVDPTGLPRLLQAAVKLDRQAEAVAVFHGAAVVLPAGAPLAFAPMPAAPRLSRRSGRLPWREALRWLENAPGLALAIDLAPTDGLAARLLAHRLARLPEPERRTPALRALGVGRVVAALRLRPVHQDGHGRLYQIGPRDAPSAFVAVRDRVLDADGAPLEHWIAVPPHMVTAREAVAWSFGLSEEAYRPAKET